MGEGKDYLVSYIEKELLCKNTRVWILRIPAWSELLERSFGSASVLGVLEPLVPVL